MNIQTDTISKIRKEFDYESYAEAHLQTKLGHGIRGNEIRACCPVCVETRFRLYLNNEKKVFNCFNCNFSNKNSDVFDLVAATERITRAQAIIRLVREFSDITPEDVQEYLSRKEDAKILPVEEDKIKTIEGLPSGVFPLEEETPLNKPFWDYLYARGLTKQEILAMKTHYSPRRIHLLFRNGKKAGNLGRRVIWPVYGGDNELVSWLARTIEPNTKKQKYLNCPLSDLSKTVWPYVNPPKGCNEAIIVEGILDCLALRRAGYTAYATFGKKMSSQQTQVLKKWGIEQLVIFYDPEAKKDIKSLVENVKMKFSKTFVVDQSNWDAKSDPGDLLAHKEGCDILHITLSKRIDVYSLDYVQWALE